MFHSDVARASATNEAIFNTGVGQHRVDPGSAQDGFDELFLGPFLVRVTT